MRWIFPAVVLAAAALAPLGFAAPGEPVPEAEPVPDPAVAEPGPSVPEPTVAADVSIGGVAVGGLTAAEAEAAVARAFERPIRFRRAGRTWRASPAELGGEADIGAAVGLALATGPGGEVPLRVAVDTRTTRSFVAGLDRALSRRPRDATLRLVGGEPRLRKGRPGLAVRVAETTRLAVRKLHLNLRTPVRIRTKPVKPRVGGVDARRLVVVQRGAKRLRFYQGHRLVRTFRIAVGAPAHPTPIGAFRVVTKQRNPWWYPPDSDWARGLRPVPPGPGNPLGTRWMGLSEPLIGIHGTPDAASIGYSASHGCIRMRVPAAEWLFERVRVGTPVYVVRG